MSTTVLEAITRLRNRLDDTGGDTIPLDLWITDDVGCLWSNVELVGYLDSAQKEFCRRHPLVDSSSELCSIQTRTGVGTYTLDPRILAIERVYYTDKTLVKITHREIIDTLSYSPTTEVKFYYEDLDARQLVLIATPEVDGTIAMSIRRLPLSTLAWEDKDDDLELDDLYVEDLLLYSGYLAWSKQDSKSLNLEAANVAADRFTSRVGGTVDPGLIKVRKEIGNMLLHSRCYF